MNIWTMRMPARASRTAERRGRRHDQPPLNSITSLDLDRMVALYRGQLPAHPRRLLRLRRETDALNMVAEIARDPERGACHFRHRRHR
jgi:hypothetical protein